MKTAVAWAEEAARPGKETAGTGGSGVVPDTRAAGRRWLGRGARSPSAVPTPASPPCRAHPCCLVPFPRSEVSAPDPAITAPGAAQPQLPPRPWPPAWCHQTRAMELRAPARWESVTPPQHRAPAPEPPGSLGRGSTGPCHTRAWVPLQGRQNLQESGICKKGREQGGGGGWVRELQPRGCHGHEWNGGSGAAPGLNLPVPGGSVRLLIPLN